MPMRKSSSRSSCSKMTNIDEDEDDEDDEDEDKDEDQNEDDVFLCSPTANGTGDSCWCSIGEIKQCFDFERR